MKISFALAAALAIAASGAQAAEQAECVTPHELRTMVAFALPVAVEGVAKQCAPRLGADSFLARQGSALAARYRREAPARWDEARPIFERVAHQHLPPPDPLSETFERQMAEHVIADRIAAAVHPRDCETVDMAMELAAPLHADDLTLLTKLLAEMLARSDDRIEDRRLPFTICPRRAER